MYFSALSIDTWIICEQIEENSNVNNGNFWNVNSCLFTLPPALNTSRMIIKFQVISTQHIQNAQMRQSLHHIEICSLNQFWECINAPAQCNRMHGWSMVWLLCCFFWMSPCFHYVENHTKTDYHCKCFVYQLKI